MKRLAIVLILALGLLSTGSAAAQNGPSVYFQPGVTSNHFTGDVGRYASGSIGIAAMQGIQFGLMGAYLALGTDFHLTNQPPPPYSRGLQTFTIATGLRIAPQIAPVRPMFGIEYANLGVVSNTLNRFTGNRLGFNAIGANAAARWRFMPPFYVEAQANVRYFVDMRSPVASIGGGIYLGLSGQL